MVLTDRIQAEKTRLQNERDLLVQKIASIDADLKDIEAALRVASKLEGTPEQEGTQIDTPTSSFGLGGHAPDVRAFSGTIKDLARDILKDAYPNGELAGGIRIAALQNYGQKINPNSLTVSLGRLKNEGAIRIEGRTWFYVPAEQKEHIDQRNESEAPALTAASETGG